MNAEERGMMQSRTFVRGQVLGEGAPGGVEGRGDGALDAEGDAVAAVAGEEALELLRGDPAVAVEVGAGADGREERAGGLGGQDGREEVLDAGGYGGGEWGWGVGGVGGA